MLKSKQILTEQGPWQDQMRPNLPIIMIQRGVSVGTQRVIAAEGMQKAKDHQKVEKDMQKEKSMNSQPVAKTAKERQKAATKVHISKDGAK